MRLAAYCDRKSLRQYDFALQYDACPAFTKVADGAVDPAPIFEVDGRSKPNLMSLVRASVGIWQHVGGLRHLARPSDKGR